jgi:Holliday junction resolvasome RuvABC DNA-binding subunit
MAMGTADNGRAGKTSGEARPAVRSISELQESELVSALVNLGCRKEKAQEVARKAQGSDFDSRLKWAIQNAA